MAQPNFERIPRGTSVGTGAGGRLAIIEAQFALGGVTDNGVRPGTITARWGSLLRGGLDMQSGFSGEVTYDGPGTPTDFDLCDRRPPYYADMERADDTLERRKLEGGGVLYVKRQTFGPELGQVEPAVLENVLRPPEESGYYAFGAYASAGEYDPGATGFVETEAAAIIGGLAQVLAVREEDARWVVQNLLPSGQLPSA